LAASARLERALTVLSGRSVSAVLDGIATTLSAAVDQAACGQHLPPPTGDADDFAPGDCPRRAMTCRQLDAGFGEQMAAAPEKQSEQ
jgi:hypothetical protein